MSRLILPTEIEKYAILRESSKAVVQNFLEAELGALQDSASKTLLDNTMSAAGITIYPLIEASHSSRFTANFTWYSDESFKGTKHPTEPTGYRSFVSPTGKPFLKDHNRWSVDAIVGRNVVSGIKKVKSGSTARLDKKMPGTWEGGYVLNLIPAIGGDSVQHILSKAWMSVSVGLRAHQIIDSISKKDILQLMKNGIEPPHYKGMEYPTNGDKGKMQLCYYIIPSWSAVECSFVVNPADEIAGVVSTDVGESKVRMLLAQKKVGEDSYEMLDAKTGEVVQVISEDSEFAYDLSYNFKDATYTGKKQWQSIDLDNITTEANIILNSLNSYGNNKMLKYDEIEKILKECYSEDEATTYLTKIQEKFDNLSDTDLDTVLANFADNAVEFVKATVESLQDSDSTDDTEKTWYQQYEESNDKETLLSALNESIKPLGVSVDGEGNINLEGIQINGTGFVETFDSQDNLTIVLDNLKIEVEKVNIKDSTDIIKDCQEFANKYSQDYAVIRGLYTTSDNDKNYLSQLVGVCRTKGITQTDAENMAKPYSIFGDSVLLRLLSTVQVPQTDSSITNDGSDGKTLSPATKPIEEDTINTSSSNPFGLLGIRNKAPRGNKSSS